LFSSSYSDYSFNGNDEDLTVSNFSGIRCTLNNFHNLFNFVLRCCNLYFGFGKKINTIFLTSPLLHDSFLLSTSFDISYCQTRVPGFFKGIFYLTQFMGGFIIASILYILVMLVLPHKVLGICSNSMLRDIKACDFFFFRYSKPYYGIEDFEDYVREPKAPNHGYKY